MSDTLRLSREAVARLSERLADVAEKLAQSLLPGGARHGDVYTAAPRKAGGPGDSLTVYVRGSKKGKWRFFGADLPAMLNGETFGDMLDLIRLTQHLDAEGARGWALRYLGLQPGSVEYRRTPAEEALARKRAAEAERAESEKTRRARKEGLLLWAACPPVSLDNPGGRYLDQRLGGGFGRLLALGWGLNALRFHPALKHPHAAGRAFPAIVALVQFPTGKVATIHRLYLTQPAPGRWDVLREKRDGLKGKLAWCAIDGGFCAVWRGSRSDPETGEVREGWPWSDKRAGPEVVVCEGIEDALSLALVQPDRRYAAALSVPNFMHLKLPEWARQVVWFADDDGSNDQTPALLERAYQRLEDEGREVAIGRPPKGFKDANDVLRGAAAHEQGPENRTADTGGSDHPSA